MRIEIFTNSLLSFQYYLFLFLEKIILKTSKIIECVYNNKTKKTIHKNR